MERPNTTNHTTDGSQKQPENDSPHTDIQTTSLDTEQILQAETISVIDTVVDDDEEPFPTLKKLSNPIAFGILVFACICLRGLLGFGFEDTDLWYDLLY